MGLTCGFAKVDITPPFGTPLAGYQHDRRAEAISDRLYARILYCEWKETSFCLIGLDLIGVDRALCETLKQQAKMDLCCWATHTHSGPGGFFEQSNKLAQASGAIFGHTQNTVREILISQIMWGIAQAKANAQEATLRIQKSAIEGIGANRHDKNGYYNPELIICEIVKKSGEKAVFYNYACHPTVLNKENQAISADFPGYAAQLVEGLDDVKLCMFLNGAAGDISTRFTRKESTLRETKRLGYKLGGALIQVIHSDAAFQEVKRIAIKQREIHLRGRDIPTEAEAEREYRTRLERLQAAQGIDRAQIRVLQSQLEGAAVNLQYAKSLVSGEKIDSILSCFLINDVCFIGIPGELTNELGDQIKSAANGTQVVVGTYFQDYIGYIVPSAEYEAGSYESFTTVLEQGTAERIIEECKTLIGTLVQGGEA